MVLQDRQGFIWIGSTDGLNRFDGINFKTFRHEPENPNSINHSDIVALHEDNKGNIWIGSHRGLNKYDPVTNSFESFLGEVNPNTQSYNFILIVASDSDGNVWGGSYHGLFKLTSINDGQDYSITEFLHDPENPNSISSNVVWEIFEDSKQNIWVGTVRGLDKVIHNKGIDSTWFEHYTHDPDNENSLSTNQVWEINEDSWGNLWIGTRNGVNKFDPESGTFTRFIHDPQNPKSLSHNYVFGLLVDDNNRLWAGTYNGGLNLAQLEKTSTELSFTSFMHQPENPKSIISNDIKDIFHDRAGIIWVGSYGGLDKIDPNENNFNLVQSSKKDASSISSNYIQAIHEDSFGNLWIGTRGGGLNFLPGKTSPQKLSGYKHFLNGSSNTVNIAHNDVYALFEDSKQRLWIGTYGGINIIQLEEDMSEFDFSTIKNYNHVKLALTHNFVFDIEEDADGVFWVATYGGLTRLIENPDGSFNSTFFEGDITDTTTIINSDSYTLCLDANDDLWIGTFMGLCVFRKDSVTGNRKFYNFLNNTNTPTSLKSDEVFVLYRDSRDFIWAGTIDGLTRIYIDENREAHFQRFSAKDSPVNGAVYAILEDEQGNLWSSGNNGITVFNPKLRQISSSGQAGIVRNYDISDGLQGNEFALRSAFINNRNQLYFGGKNGMNFFNPQDIKSNPFLPAVVFTDFRLSYKSVNPGSPDYTKESPLQKSISHTSEIELKYWQNIFSIEFVGLNYTQPLKNKYRYKLDGFDPEWVYSGNNNLATYTNLDPGTYTFRVMASNNDGVWNPTDKTLLISILPPPWETWWAYTLYLILIILVLFVYNRYRVNKLRQEMTTQIKIERAKLSEREQVRKKNAADFHDELGHNVTKITLFAEMARRENKSGSELQNYLDKITDNVKSLSGGIRDFIWALDPDKDSFYETLLRLQEFGDTLFEFSDVKFVTRGFSDRFAGVKLTADTRRHIILIFKEAMNNCLKYANCNNAELSAQLENGKIRIMFSDDGEGFEMDDQSTGNGLNNMADRAKKINGILEIDSTISHGVTIVLEIEQS